MISDREENKPDIVYNMISISIELSGMGHIESLSIVASTFIIKQFARSFAPGLDLNFDGFVAEGHVNLQV